MMEAIVSLVLTTKTPMRNDDDVVDRLSHRYSSMMILTFALCVMWHQYVGAPMTCWGPKHFTDPQIAFANNYCWVRNTYYLPFENIVPSVNMSAKQLAFTKGELIYYQWLPFILLAQAIAFRLPTHFWRAFNTKSGVDADNIVDSAANYQKIKPSETDRKERTLRMVTLQVDRFLGGKRAASGIQALLKRAICACCGVRFGAYLFILYLLVKLMYIANIVLQLVALTMLFRNGYASLSLDLLQQLVQVMNTTKPALNATAFPRVTMCDFSVRRLGNVHNYTVQCLLPINLYAERIYIFLWFWLLVLGAITVLSLVQWVVRAICPFDRLHYVRRHLEAGGAMAPAPSPENAGQRRLYLRAFVYHYLSQDGVFLFRLIGHNTSAITVSEVLSDAWLMWLGKHKKPGRTQKALAGAGPWIDDPSANKPLLQENPTKDDPKTSKKPNAPPAKRPTRKAPAPPAKAKEKPPLPPPPPPKPKTPAPKPPSAPKDAKKIA